MPLDEQILKKYPNLVFVETGTNYGVATQYAINIGFKKIISIEIDLELYKYNIKKYKDIHNVSLYLGNSSTMLYNLIKNISQPITFWLDAHKEIDDNCPLFLELDQIKLHHIKTHTILIDDRRCFEKELKNITEQEIITKLFKINRNYKIKYESSLFKDDIIVATI